MFYSIGLEKGAIVKGRSIPTLFDSTFKIIMVSLLFAACFGFETAGGKEVGMSPDSHFFAQLLPSRPDFDKSMSPEEQLIMGQHFRYLKGLASQNKVLAAGPCFDPLFGLIIIRAHSRAEAESLLQNDPSVKSGLNAFRIQPMTLSVFADLPDRSRYEQNPAGRVLRKEVIVNGSLSDVWKAWTTTDGVKTFFSHTAKVEPFPGGAYEILFNPEEPIGKQGSEGCRVLLVAPYELFAFDWNAPPEFGGLRDIHTQVVLRFERIAEGKTKVIFSEYGWGDGPEWDELYAYFDRAWNYVLLSLKKRFESGPIDWGKE